MRQARQRREALVDEIAAGAASQVGDEADTAGILFELGTMEWEANVTVHRAAFIVCGWSIIKMQLVHAIYLFSR